MNQKRHLLNAVLIAENCVVEFQRKRTTITNSWKSFTGECPYHRKWTSIRQNQRRREVCSKILIYDANDIHFYSHGPVRINLPGVRFNNRNWPHILRVVRWWSVGMLTLWPVICGLLHWLLPELWHRIGLFVTLAATLGGLFVPICIAAKKYE